MNFYIINIFLGGVCGKTMFVCNFLPGRVCSFENCLANVTTAE